MTSANNKGRPFNVSRRSILAAGSAGIAACAFGADPVLRALAAAPGKPLGPKAFLTKLCTNLDAEDSYPAEIEGTLPAGLTGTLYRNGPGLFERAGYKKGTILDGDGLIQRFQFSGGAATYAARFVRTPKFVEEEKLGKFKYPTWTTRAPDGFWANLGGGEIVSQAGVTVYPHAGRILALDEVGELFSIDPTTLETLGPIAFGPNGGKDIASGAINAKAHTKTDPETGDFISLGQTYGRTMTLHLMVNDVNGRLKTSTSWAAPRQVYFHDFFASKNYVVAILNPAFLDLVGFLTGRRAFTESLDWKPDQGNIVAVMRRDGTGELRVFEAQGTWVWHALNAFERGDELVLDFVGYKAPDHFLGPEAAFRKIMEGETGLSEAPGLPMRYTMNLSTGKLAEEALSARNTEFPMTDLRLAGAPTRAGFFTYAPAGEIFHDGVLRIDYETGAEDSYRFENPTHVGEPIFAPGDAAPGGNGWLLSLCLDGASGRSFLAVFEAGALAGGPIAKVWLRAHAPLSFHGAFVA